MDRLQPWWRATPLNAACSRFTVAPMDFPLASARSRKRCSGDVVSSTPPALGRMPVLPTVLKTPDVMWCLFSAPPSAMLFGEGHRSSPRRNRRVSRPAMYSGNSIVSRAIDGLMNLSPKVTAREFPMHFARVSISSQSFDVVSGWVISSHTSFTSSNILRQTRRCSGSASPERTPSQNPGTKNLLKSFPLALTTNAPPMAITFTVTL
mmetsp:Transcript_14041/g.33660  ORF Transcript_14041/g.33660 Transcript_14041/m.33660 type:complete len:207 (+) Transcript_14041:1316-1936(+)